MRREYKASSKSDIEDWVRKHVKQGNVKIVKTRANKETVKVFFVCKKER